MQTIGQVRLLIGIAQDIHALWGLAKRRQSEVELVRPMRRVREEEGTDQELDLPLFTERDGPWEIVTLARGHSR